MSLLALVRLRHELAIWRRAWRKPILWWRDDDARTATWQLDRLLYARGDLPLTLAVIPDVDLKPLSHRLARERGVAIAQHGVDHENRLTVPGRRSEFPDATSQGDINAALAAGRARLAAAGLPPAAFTPPWNEADARLIEAIAAAGYGAWSAGIYGSARSGLQHVGAQIDVLRWKGEPHFRGRHRIFNALRKELELRRETGCFEEPIGLLTHHLVMDEASWTFLDDFLAFSKPLFDWRSLPDLIAAPSQPADVARLHASAIG